MKLVFYSGGDEIENQALDQYLLSLTPKKDPRITYVPSSYYDSEADFRDFIKSFRYYNIHHFLEWPIDLPFDKVMKAEALKSDIIFLSGGNTFYFLHSIRSNCLEREFVEFVKSGGVLAGLSAGAILMTPSIHTAGFPSFDCDENEVGIQNLKALDLVGFEFFPHYKNSSRYEKVLKEYSKKRRIPIYACPNGSGIAVEDEKTIFFGKTFCFYQGEKITMRPKQIA